jgi:hypothetical protein
MLVAGLRITVYFAAFVAISVILDQWELLVLPILFLAIGAIIKRSPV